MTEMEYVQLDGQYCPVCHSTNINRRELHNTTSNLATATTSCNGCDSSWQDVYQLFNVEIKFRGK